MLIRSLGWRVAWVGCWVGSVACSGAPRDAEPSGGGAGGVASAGSDSTGAGAGAASGSAASGGAGGTPSAGAGGNAHLAGAGGTAGAAPQAGGSGAAAEGGAGGEAGQGNGCQRPVLLVVDRSVSMAEHEVAPGVSLWAAVQSALGVVYESTADVGWGLKLFPEGNLEACSPAGVTELIDVAPAPGQALQVLNAVQASVPEGNGTATAAAIERAVSFLAPLPSTNRPSIVLITDGAPSCLGNQVSTSPEATLAAVSALSAGAANGIHTFVVVVGAPTLGDISELSLLADAGLEARPQTNPLNAKYYEGTSEVGLRDALAEIASKVNDCD